MHTIMRAGLLALLCVAGCGERSQDAAARDAALEEVRQDDGEILRQVAERRKRFLGDGKAHYTPQPVEDF